MTAAKPLDAIARDLDDVLNQFVIHMLCADHASVVETLLGQIGEALAIDRARFEDVSASGGRVASLARGAGPVHRRRPDPT